MELLTNIYKLKHKLQKSFIVFDTDDEYAYVIIFPYSISQLTAFQYKKSEYPVTGQIGLLFLEPKKTGGKFKKLLVEATKKSLKVLRKEMDLNIIEWKKRLTQGFLLLLVAV